MSKTLRFFVLSVLLVGAPALSGCDEAAETATQTHALDANEHDDHAGHNGHSNHGEDTDEIEMSAQEAKALGIAISQVGIGSVGAITRLPAEIRYDADRIARIAAPIGGIVRELHKTEGDEVQSGQALATISSRELADLKAEFLSAKAAENLARTERDREERLFKEKITAESDVLAARSTFLRAVASREATETKLHALGLEHDVLDKLESAEDGALSLFTLKSPIGGQIVRRSLTLGQAVDESQQEPLFVIADTSVVWADIAVYKTDLSNLEKGQYVRFENDAARKVAEGTISFISVLIDEASRTATARVIIKNESGQLRPGQFLTAIIEGGDHSEVLQIPENAVQTVEGRSAVFVPTDHGFAVRVVEIGARSAGHVEIRSGLREGESYVTEGAFTLKAELEKSAFGDGHAH